MNVEPNNIDAADVSNFFAGGNIAPVNKEIENISNNPIIDNSIIDNSDSNPQSNNSFKEDDLVKSFTSLIQKDVNKLSTEEKEFSTNLLKEINATSYDTEGNFIRDNKVVFTKQDIENYLKTGDFPLDDKGNMVNRLGEIVLSKEELDKQSSIIYSSRSLLETKLGIELKDEQGNLKDYSDDEEGIVQMTVDTAQQLTIQSIDAFFNDNPQVKSYYLHLASGGNPDNFSVKEEDYSKVNLESLSKEQKIGYIRKYLTEAKVPNPESLLGLIDKAGDEVINTQTAESLLNLITLNKDKVAEQQKQIQLQKQKEQEEIKNYWNTVKKTVSAGKLGSLTLPKDRINDFFNYLSTPVDKTGKSKDMIMQEQEPLENSLMISYLRYNNWDLSKLVNVMAEEKKILSFRERVKKQNNNSTKGNHYSNKSNTPSVAEGNQVAKFFNN